MLGISPDGEEKHQKFIGKYDLPFTLLCDPDKKVMAKYGAFGEKKLSLPQVLAMIYNERGLSV